MALIILRDINLAFGGPKLLENVNLSISRGERIGLLGRNGMGKSTLLNVINHHITPDDGALEIESGTVITQLEQSVASDLGGTIYHVVAGGLSAVGDLLERYHQLTLQLADDSTPELLQAYHDCQQALEENNAWHYQQQVNKVISKLELDAEANFEQLSGGMKRRVLLARALVREPNVLLLDEPTNHLDIDSILWLEKFLKDYSATLIFITHDRAFLQNLATRIIELDRGQLTDWPGDYQLYLEKKQHALDIESRSNALFDKKLAQEETWIRQGIKARRTRNEGRVRALEKLREQRSQRRNKTGTANIQLQQAEKSGKDVIKCKNVSYSINGKPIIKDFNLQLQRGDKLGIIGPNGCGKSTLLKLLFADLTPDQGTIKQGTQLDVAYMDQLRATLDDDKTLLENVGQGSDVVHIGKTQKHIIGYLQDFLFTPAQARAPITKLSGGERNRALLAKLFTQRANVLVLDEPTNDLDLETLELLESLLVDFDGTVVVVSHDRSFLNNICTSMLAYIEPTKFVEFVGGYDDYIRQIKTIQGTAKSKPQPAPAPKTKPKSDKKLSYNEQRELSSLPKKIEKLEASISELQTQCADPEFYKDEQLAQSTLKTLSETESELQAAYDRWEELERNKE